MPPLEGRLKRADRKKAYTDRARAALETWLDEVKVAEPA
jgi:methylenetetrahydrofolate--tRNA-(uracil-5-)-methyltransferase